MKLSKKRDKAKMFLAQHSVDYDNNKIPDTLLAKKIHRLLNSTDKNFNEKEAQDYIKSVRLSMGAVYAIGNIKHGYVKIDYSKDPRERIKSIQTGCPFKISILKVWNGLTRKDEKTLHREYEPYQTQGEWFKIKGKLKHDIFK